MPRPFRYRGVALAVVAVLVLLGIVVAVASSLRTTPRTWSVGDGAVLEIYTLHAARRSLDVGPYSRFGWNHPGPAHFYTLAPAYVLSGHREEGLLLTALALNLAAMAALLAVAARYGGWAFAGALIGWLALYYFRPGTQAGWDFGDLLSSAWNPHAPLLPFALLLVLAAVVAAGHLGALPVVALVASFISQSHVAFLPMSVLISGVAVMAWAWPYVSIRRDAIPHRPVSNLVRVVDAIGAIYVGLMAWVIVAGGFEAHMGPIAISVHSIDKLLLYALVLVGVRHLLSRNHPFVHRVLVRAAEAATERRRAGQPSEDRDQPNSQWPAGTKRWLIATVAVAAALWSVPVFGELTGPQPGNLARLARSIGGGQVPDIAAGAAAFAHHLSGVVRPGFEVAAGGRVLGAGVATWPVALFAAFQIAALVLAWRSAATHGRRFLAAQAGICLVASAGALWASIRVGGELHDHITFWISILGVVNLAVLTAELVACGASGAAALLGRGSGSVVALWSPARRGTAVLVIGAFIAIVAAHGGRHIAAGHHRDRFAGERTTVQNLANALRASFNVAPSGGAVRVDMAQDAWPIAAGLVLELYKRDIDVTVADEWVSLFGPPLASNGHETTELVVADADAARVLAADGRYELVASAAGVAVYRRPL